MKGWKNREGIIDGYHSVIISRFTSKSLVSMFNNQCTGPRAIFSGDNSVVERREPEKYNYGCMCYTSHPLPPGQVWEITILNTTSGWSLGLVSGCVLYLLYHLFMSVLVHYQ